MGFLHLQGLNYQFVILSWDLNKYFPHTLYSWFETKFMQLQDTECHYELWTQHKCFSYYYSWHHYSLDKLRVFYSGNEILKMNVGEEANVFILHADASVWGDPALL